MNEKTLSILGFNKLKEEIAAFCVSEEGCAEFLCRLPSANTEEVQRLKRLGIDWSREAASENPPPLSSWQPVASLFPLIEAEGAFIPAESIASLGAFCRVSEALRLWGGSGKSGECEDSTSVRTQAAALPDLSEARSAIFSIIDEDGAFRDLPQLASIKKRIAETRRDIEKRMSRLCSDPAITPMLQSFLPALRGGRQVLAVKANFRGRIPGIVHEVSQSGQTIYIEPADVVELGNVLVTEELHLEREKKEILRNLAEKLRGFCPAFKAALKTLILFDGLAAACRWGKENACTFALDLPQGETASDESGVAFRLNLLRARHPFLREKAVPINISIPEGANALIITGPNAGGKTVALKTAGLFALANQCGWPIPAAEGSSLSVFDYIDCDIGDDQSIESSLSTFSAHMQNTAEILGHSGAESLVLLDELGSGTDPEEGSSLAMAILDALIKKGALVVVTTHHAAIKHYGFAGPTCINASVEFNAETLEPSYKLIMGLPGESRAIDIATRSGIPQEIAAAARSYLSGGGADVAQLIQKLKEKHSEMLCLEEKLKMREADLSEATRELDLRELRLKQEEMQLRESEYGKMHSFFLESRKQLESLVRKIREEGGAVSKETTLAAKAWAENFEAELKAEKDVLQEEAIALNAKEEVAKCAVPIEVSMEVLVAPSGMRGKVLRRGKKGNWIVEAGSLKLSVPESSLSPAPAASGSSSAALPAFEGEGRAEKPAFELRLLGMRRAEAEQALTRQLDLCAMAGLHEFSVVHGKGGGILQEAVAAVLRMSPAVAEFHFAPPESGGTGKTIVRLTQR